MYRGGSSYQLCSEAILLNLEGGGLPGLLPGQKLHPAVQEDVPDVSASAGVFVVYVWGGKGQVVKERY